MFLFHASAQAAPRDVGRGFRGCLGDEEDGGRGLLLGWSSTATEWDCVDVTLWTERILFLDSPFWAKSAETCQWDNTVLETWDEQYCVQNVT